MASCENPCSPCCKYGESRKDESNIPKDVICAASPTQNLELQVPKMKETTEIPDLRPVPEGDPPCYLPQAEDVSGKKVSSGETPQMGPIGPWATGRVDWGPLAGLTGTRPVVSKYSVTRYSEGEWRQRNADVFNDNYAQQRCCHSVAFNSHQCLERTRAETDKDQSENTKRVIQRANDIHRWRCELEQAIADTTVELDLLQEQYTRLKQAMSILTIPESIAAECIDVRSTRLEPDLVRDEVEEELIKELALTGELRDTFNRILADISLQIIEEKTAKQRLEYDWSDKKTAHEIESLNASLNNRSLTIMFKPGATRLPEDQSTGDYWDHFTRESLYQSEMTRQKAVALRSTLDAILTNASRDLRTQADKVDSALAKRIACVEELRNKLEIELKKILRQLVETEQLIETLQNAIKRMDFPMKVAQTRLDNKLQLPRVENCREESHIGLVKEVKSISENVAALSAQLKQAEECKANLLITRGTLERELMIKLKNLWIEKDRIQLMRSHYPSATALSGY